MADAEVRDGLEQVAEAIAAGERIDATQALLLLRHGRLTELGALAAALQATACRKVLAGEAETGGADGSERQAYELTLATTTTRARRTSLRRRGQGRAG